MMIYLRCAPTAVAPRVGAWIETYHIVILVLSVLSHPVWVRGLKHVLYFKYILKNIVAPRVGAWIETFRKRGYYCSLHVAPRVGAWIETKSK